MYVLKYIIHSTAKNNIMTVSATFLRQNIYKLLDQTIKTGMPINIMRNGKQLKIISVTPTDKLKNLKKRNIIVGNPEDLIKINFEKEWKPYI
jgi:hypothetical protein